MPKKSGFARLIAGVDNPQEAKDNQPAPRPDHALRRQEPCLSSVDWLLLWFLKKICPPM